MPEMGTKPTDEAFAVSLFGVQVFETSFKLIAVFLYLGFVLCLFVLVEGCRSYFEMRGRQRQPGNEPKAFRNERETETAKKGDVIFAHRDIFLKPT